MTGQPVAGPTPGEEQDQGGARQIGRVLRNGSFNVIRLVITVPIFMALTPFMLRHLGEAAYGAWALVATTLALTALGDFGITAALTRYVAADDVKGRGDLNTIVNTAAAVYAVVAGAVAVALVAIHPWLLNDVFRLPPELIAETRLLLLGSLLAVLLNFIASAYYSVLPGLQRYGATNVASLAGAVASAGTTAAVLLLDGGLAQLALAPWAQALASGAVNVATLRRVAPGLRLLPGSVRLDSAKELLSFSTRAAVGQFSEFAAHQMDKLLLGIFIGAVEVGIFHVASMVVRYVRSVPVLLLSPLLPMSSELAEQGHSQRLTRVFHDAVRYSWALGALTCAGVLVFAEPFMGAWLGSGYSPENIARGVVVLQILGVALFLNVLSAPFTYLMLGIGDASIPARAAGIHLVLNVLLTLALIRPFDLAGVAAATLVAEIFGVAYLIVASSRKVGETLVTYLQLAARPAVAAIVAAGVVWPATVRWGPESWSLAAVLAAGLSFAVGYTLLLVLLRFLRPDERDHVRRFWRRDPETPPSR